MQSMAILTSKLLQCKPPSPVKEPPVLSVTDERGKVLHSDAAAQGRRLEPVLGVPEDFYVRETQPSAAPAGGHTLPLEEPVDVATEGQHAVPRGDIDEEEEEAPFDEGEGEQHEVHTAAKEPTQARKEVRTT